MDAQAFEPHSIDSEYSAASVVAMVRIQSGEIVERSGRTCGALFSAEVVESFKGPYSPSSVLEFRGVMGIALGRQYLVFLSDSQSDPDSQLRVALGIGPSAECADTSPALRIWNGERNLIGGIDSMSPNRPPEKLDFMGLWSLPREVEHEGIRRETNLGTYVGSRASTSDVLEYLRQLASRGAD